MVPSFKYSIIIPHFNIPELLERLILTIPRREDLQVIVIDDCSNKKINELKVLQKKYNWIEWLSTGTNGGGGKARNVGLNKAKGEYLLFADADDFFLPNLNQVLDEYKKENNFDIIFFNSISLNSETLLPENRGRNWKELEKYISGSLEDYLRYQFGEPWCKLVKKDLIIKHAITFDEIPVHNDTLFSYQIGFHAKVVTLDDRAIYCITERNNSVSKKFNENVTKIRTEVFAKKNRFFKENRINQFDNLLIFPFFEASNNPKLLTELYNITQKYGFSEKEIKRIKTDFLKSKFKNKFIRLKYELSKFIKNIK